VSFVSFVLNHRWNVGKALVLIGLGIAALGLAVMLGVPLGRLPGDFYVRRGSFSFYFPLATSIVLSIILTLLLAFFRR
jgi:predicted MFS family arabinose efflux permease